MSELTKLYLKEFHDPDTRHIYADNFLNTFIATQIKVLREDRDWTQSKLAEQAGMKQERISVLENVNYESWSVKTLKRLAKAFDLRLSIKFESFGSYLTDYDNFNRDNLKRPSFAEDPIFHRHKATSVTAGQSIDLLAAMKQKLTTHEPVSTSAVQQTLVFSSPELVSQKENSTSNQPVIEPAARAAAA